MTYDIKWLTDSFARGEKPKYLFFWGHQKSKSGELTASCFSQWWIAPFTFEGVEYPSAEHWMMARKALLFDDQTTLQKILSAKSPAEAKSLGRQVQGFSEATWLTSRMDIVVQGTLHKFSQNPELKQFLQSTKDKVLVEASPVDKIWGIGLAADAEQIENPTRWKGLNLLGFALMEVRDMLS